MRENETMCPYLCWHVHQQHCSDGGLGLAVALLWPVQGVGLQHTEQVLLPGPTGEQRKTEKLEIDP